MATRTHTPFQPKWADVATGLQREFIEASAEYQTKSRMPDTDLVLACLAIIVAVMDDEEFLVAAVEMAVRMGHRAMIASHAH